MDGQVLKQLTTAQETWARAILGWNADLQGSAAISDLGWLHITRKLMLIRCSLYARLKNVPNAQVFTSIKDIMDAAAHSNMGWSHQTRAMFRAAVNPMPPPSGEVTWQSMLPLALRNLRLVDEVLKQVALLSAPDLPHYPKHRSSPSHHNMVYHLQLQFAKCSLFGSLRAGAKIFPGAGKICPACDHEHNGTAYILRGCPSILICLNTWARHVKPFESTPRFALDEQAFAKSIFDISSFQSRTSRRATVTFVWEATQAAKRAATRRRDAV